MRLPVPKLFPSRKIFMKILYTVHSLITINSKINEVDKSRIIRINERLRERKTQST